MPARWTLPALDPHNRPFFTSGRIALQECAKCATVQHPPEEVCHSCQGTEFSTLDAEGRGTIYSFVVVHHAANPALADRVPYTVVLVSLDDLPGVRIVGNLIGPSPDRVRIGLPVRALWEEIDLEGETLLLPQWQLDEGADAD
jgi:uncharacterized OB-fold protein